MPLQRRTFGRRSASAWTSSSVRRSRACSTTPSCRGRPPGARDTAGACRRSSTSPPCRSGRSCRSRPRCATTSRRFSRQRSYESSSPSAVSLTLTFESSAALSIAAKTSSYACAIARVSSSCVISSPSTSTVAIFPPPLRPRTHSTASASVAPAMYREEKSCTTGFGTAGRRRTRVESSSDTGAASMRHGRREPSVLSAGVVGSADDVSSLWGCTSAQPGLRSVQPLRRRQPIRRRRAMQWIDEADAVFRGGGVKGLALAGALCGFAEHPTKPVHTWKSVAGASAGAIIACYLATGHDAEEMLELMQRTPLRPVRRLPGRQQGARHRTPAGRTRHGARQGVRVLVRRRARRRDVLGRAEARGHQSAGAVVAEAHRRGRHRGAAPRAPRRPPALPRSEHRAADRARRLPDRAGGADEHVDPVLLRPRRAGRHAGTDLPDRRRRHALELPRLALGRRPEGQRPPADAADVRLHPLGRPRLRPPGFVTKVTPWHLRFGFDIFHTAESAWDERFVSHSTRVRTLAVDADDVGTTDFNLSQEKQELLVHNGRAAAKAFLDSFSLEQYENTYHAGLAQNSAAGAAA